jgi:hypothetical protein
MTIIMNCGWMAVKVIRCGLYVYVCIMHALDFRVAAALQAIRTHLPSAAWQNLSCRNLFYYFHAC